MLQLGMSLPSLRARGEAIGALPALGLLTLAGLTDDNWSKSWHESAACESLLDEVLNERPTLVAVSALTASIEDAYDFARDVRTHGIATVAGGLHVTALPEESEQHFDAVVVGDGEPVWPELLVDAAAGRLKRWYQASTPFDLADSPLPDYSLTRTRALTTHKRQRFTMQTARGCPLACSFCAASRVLGKFREKPLERIRAELEVIRSIDPHPLIELADDNTFAGSRNHAELLELFAASDVTYFTESDWRLGERPELLASLARSGCVQVLVGIESRVHEFTGMGAKVAPIERVLDAIAAIQQAGVAVNACLVVGADGETPESLEQLARFLEAAPFADVQLTLATPFPGSVLRTQLARQGRLLARRGWSHHTLFDVTFQPDGMTVTELEASFRQLVSVVFSPAQESRRRRIRQDIYRHNQKLGGWLS